MQPRSGPPATSVCLLASRFGHVKASVEELLLFRQAGAEHGQDLLGSGLDLGRSLPWPHRQTATDGTASATDVYFPQLRRLGAEVGPGDVSSGMHTATRPKPRARLPVPQPVTPCPPGSENSSLSPYPASSCSCVPCFPGRGDFSVQVSGVSPPRHILSFNHSARVGEGKSALRASARGRCPRGRGPRWLHPAVPRARGLR